ncbi:MAG: serine/threonine-protein kinase [Polyangiales bacterium]
MTEPTGVDITLGRYRLAFELASGGMATVYLACLEGAAGVDKVVAVKRIHPHLAKDEEYVQMFLDEARLASQIHHTNVCSVTDFGQVDGAYFLVMEYLTGVPLNRLIAKMARERDEVPSRWVPIVSKLVRDAAEGLHAAHELTAPDGSLLGVVHRDVSPHNLFVGFDGQLRVIDFGVAKAAGKLHQTSTGQAKGKVAYMAPEQVQHGQVDRRSDVWALGVVLWESLTLRRLFRRPSPGETVYAVMQDSVADPRSYRSEVPKQMAQAVSDALDRDPEKRTKDARTFATALANSWTGTDEAMVTAAEVGDLLRELFPGEEAKQKQLVSLARQGNERVAQAGLGGTSPSFSSLSYATVPTTIDATSSSAVVPLERKRPRWLIPLLVAFAVSMGVVVGLVTDPEPANELATASEPAAEVESAPPPAPEPVLAVPEALPEEPEAQPDEPVNEPAAVEPEEAAEPPSSMDTSMARTSMSTMRRSTMSTMQSTMENVAATAVPEPPDETPVVPMVTMEAAPGRLTVVVPGGWANVYGASGRFLGATPLNREMPPGHHRLQLRFGGQPPAVSVEVDVPAGGVARISRRAP